MKPPRSKWHRARRIGRIAACLVALWLLASWIVAYRLTHRHRPPFAEPTPAVTWAKFESARLATSDGHEIGAWYASGRKDAPAVVLIHGNGGSRWNCLTRAETLANAGYAVLLISLRAHGDSTGDFNDIGYSARRDVVAAVEYLERRRPDRPVVVLGTSLGGAAALFAAADLGHRVAGYILESPYRDLKVAVRNRTRNSLPPGLDWLAYQGLLAVSPLVLPDLAKISPHEAITCVPADVPILILAGDEDVSARRDEAQALFDRVRSHGELHLFPRAGHLQMIGLDPDRYWHAVLKLLHEVETSRMPVRRATNSSPEVFSKNIGDFAHHPFSVPGS